MTEPVPAAPAERAGGRSYKAVYLVFFGLLLSAGIAAAVMYFKLLHYHRVAALHLPPDTTAAARIDVENVALFEPVRKHLLPLANTLRAGDPRLKPRLKRLEQHTRIEFAVDLREIAVVRGPSPGDWMVIFGGLFPKGNIVPGLREVFAEEGMNAQLSPNGRAFTLPGGVAVGQSQDGCLLIAASASRLESAIPQQDTFQRLGLAREGPGGFAFSGEFLKSLPDAANFLLTAAEMGEIARAYGQLRLGNPVEISTQVELRSKAEPAEAERLVRSMQLDVQAASVQNLGFWTLIWGRDSPIHSPAPGLVQFDSPWGRPDIDRTTEDLARRIGFWVDGPKGPG